MILIEGPRNTGKTFLLKKNKIKTYKLSYSEIDKKFEIDSDKKMSMGYAIGKDIQLMKLNKEIGLNITIDRGFLTTIVYSILNKRCTEEWADAYLKYIKDNYITDIFEFRIIFITGENKKIRKKDKWDNLGYNIQHELYSRYLSKLVKYVYFFDNKFDNNSIENFGKLYNTIK